MGNHKKYWKSELELSNDSSIVDNLKNNEFVNELPIGAFESNESGIENSSSNRRDFLKYLAVTMETAPDHLVKDNQVDPLEHYVNHV